jgi:hypothetical protein
LFNQPNLAKFNEPVVAGVDYPKIGLSRAFNDDAGVLHFTTYPATPSHRGQATSFRVENLPLATGVTVRRDGAPYQRWRATADGVIEIQTEIEQHDFQVLAGSRSREASDSAGANRGKRSTPTAVLPATADVTAKAVRGAGLLLVSGAGTCPCCA